MKTSSASEDIVQQRTRNPDAVFYISGSTVIAYWCRGLVVLFRGTHYRVLQRSRHSSEAHRPQSQICRLGRRTDQA
jgi:hypothetical protein